MTPLVCATGAYFVWFSAGKYALIRLSVNSMPNPGNCFNTFSRISAGFFDLLTLICQSALIKSFTNNGGGFECSARNENKLSYAEYILNLGELDMRYPNVWRLF